MKQKFQVHLTSIFACILMAGCAGASHQIDVDAVENDGIDITAASDHLSKAVQIKTISYSDTSATESDAFNELNQFIESTYPELFTTLTHERVNDFSLLFTWQGSKPELHPIVLLAHTDVVPADTSSNSPWKFQPFSGAMVDEAIWGRGTLDDKLSAFGILEATSYLIKKGYKPERSIIIAIGHDEEIGGEKGAAQIAALLKNRGVRADFVLDEGGVIVTQGVPGISAPVALIGIAEKGFLSVKLTAKATGGHSSMPPRETAVGSISQAIVNLEKHQMPGTLEGPVKEMLVTLAPETSFPFNFLFSNLWAFGGIIESQLAGSPKSNALIRTTTAPTIIRGGMKDNILPSEAEAVVNFRLKPGDTVEDVVNHVVKVVDNPNVSVTPFTEWAKPASKVSPYKNEQFTALAKSIRQSFPGVLVSPYITLAGTDAIHYEIISDNVYRFLPVKLSSERLDEIHGVDEHLTQGEYKSLINFYVQVISNTTGSDRMW